MDLKIEVTKLYALHEACKRLEHGIKDVGLESDWKVFSPTRFIYSYFTFNSIFNIDWDKSLRQEEAVYWAQDVSGRFPREKDQIKGYVRFCRDDVGSDISRVFAKSLQSSLFLFGIQDPHKALLGIRPKNETTRVRRYREAFPTNFAKLQANALEPADHYSTLITALMFIYAVRNNVFHGSKTRIEMEDESQQQRLLIYSALLIATNSLLFEIFDRSDISWHRPSVMFSSTHLIQAETAT